MVTPHGNLKLMSHHTMTSNTKSILSYTIVLIAIIKRKEHDIKRNIYTGS